MDMDTPFIFPLGSGRPQPPLPAPYLQLCKSVSGFARGTRRLGPGLIPCFHYIGKVVPLRRCHNFLFPLINQKARPMRVGPAGRK